MAHEAKPPPIPTPNRGLTLLCAFRHVGSSVLCTRPGCTRSLDRFHYRCSTWRVYYFTFPNRILDVDAAPSSSLNVTCNHGGSKLVEDNGQKHGREMLALLLPDMYDSCAKPSEQSWQSFVHVRIKPDRAKVHGAPEAFSAMTCISLGCDLCICCGFVLSSFIFFCWG